MRLVVSRGDYILVGGVEGIRTLDLLRDREARWPLRYDPKLPVIIFCKYYTFFLIISRIYYSET